MAPGSLALPVSGMCAAKRSPGSEPAERAQVGEGTRVLPRGGPWLPSDSQEGARPPSRGHEPPLESRLLTEVPVPGDAAWYCTLTTLARALAQYLLVLPKLPGHLRLPPEKERDTVKVVVTTLEVMGSLNVAFLCAGRGASCVSPHSGLTTSKRWAIVPTPQMRGAGACAVL